LDPDGIAAVDVEEGTQDALIGGAKVMSQIFGRKDGYCFEHPLVGPDGVVDMLAEGFRTYVHFTSYNMAGPCHNARLTLRIMFSATPYRSSSAKRHQATSRASGVT